MTQTVEERWQATWEQEGLYRAGAGKRRDELLERLGKYSTGKSCLYINKLADVDGGVLRELTVAVLHHLDGYTQDQIAASLDLSRKTVGKVLGKFEEHVKKRAARLGFDPGQKKKASDG